MNEPIRHHVVPRFYLDRWGSGQRRVHARRRGGANFVASTSRVAVEAGFYNIVEQDGRTSAVVEKYLSSIEGPGADALRSIDSTGEPPVRGTEERWCLASLFALQHTRSPEQRARTMFHEDVRAFLAGRDLSTELVAEYLSEHHLGFVPTANEVEAALGWVSASMHMAGSTSVNDSIETMLASARELAPIIEQMNWTVERDRRGRFISSDTPLTLWRPPTPRDRVEGIGFQTCTEIRVPLDPWTLLVLHRESRPSSIQASTDRPRRCNADVARGCHELIFGTVQQGHMINTASLRPKRPVLRFAVGPGFQELPDGSTEPLGDIVHNWVPRY